VGANDLILHLRKSGFSIGLHGDRLQVAPAEKLTDEFKHTIRQSKPEILIELQREALRDLVLEVMAMVGEPRADWQSYVDAALADPVDAMVCYSALRSELVNQRHKDRIDMGTTKKQITNHKTLE
jgi:hypothetical protein